MKKFIFGVMLLVSLLGIVGCSNPSNSDDFENVVYTLKNGLTDRDLNPISMTISYKNKSGVYVTERTVPANGTYEIPASNAKTGTKVQPSFEGERTVPVIYVKINNKEACYIAPKEGVYKVTAVVPSGDLNIVSVSKE